MKKGQIFEGYVERIDFPNKGIITIEDEKVIVKNAITGQNVRFQINKKRKGKCEAKLLEVISKSPIELDNPCCTHFSVCGGCTYQSLPYEKQLELKESQVKKLLEEVCEDFDFQGILGSPRVFEYRNKMEFSFGDEVKDGPLVLGLHKRGSFYDIVEVNKCAIIDEDFRVILKETLNYFGDKELPYYRKMQHTGYLRHLVVRKAVKTEEILVNIVTTSQMDFDMSEFSEMITCLKLSGKIAGVLHTINNSLSDVVQSDDMKILHGNDYFYEEILGLKFKISPFSFFQTNSLGAEVLYEKVREFIGLDNSKENKVVFDLYSGTGTIAQMLSPSVDKVIGVEIVEEAVEAAKVNADINNLTNCHFIAGDVLKVIDEIDDKPDYIILDPPRDGINPKALEKIIDFGVDRMVYVSCKPTSLARDLVVLQARGYKVEKVCCVDMFPGTVHVETVCLLSRKAQ